MNAQATPRHGLCPFCGASFSAYDILIEYETDDGPAAYAECPDCRDVVSVQQ